MPAASPNPFVGKNRNAIRVEGLASLQRAFSVAAKYEAKALRKGLREAAEPIATDATALARVEIDRIGPNWSRMRVGVTRTSVYVAPIERGTRTRRKRPNLAGKLLGEALLPALDHNRPAVVDAVDDVLAATGRVWAAA